METLTVLEHETLPIVKQRKTGQKALTPEHGAILAKLEQRLPARTFSWGHHSITFSQFCGVISLGKISLEILPKIHGKEAEPGSCRKALIRMLVKAGKMKASLGGLAGLALQKHSLLDVFVLYFCDQLHAELMQGMLKNYIQREENLHVVRGRLLIGRQLKQNINHREKLYCRYDELSADTLLNRILKFTLRMMLRLPVGMMARKQLSELLMRFDAISDRHIEHPMLDGLSFDRTTVRYEPLLDQCRWFLQGLHPDVLAGHALCITLLFDMNRLFESYIAHIFHKTARSHGIRLREQSP